MDNNGFGADDVAGIIQLGYEDFLQAWALTHNTTIPVNPNTPVITQPLPGGGRFTLPSNTLIIVAVAIVAIVVLSK